MSEFIDAILSPINFAFTVLLGCFLFYWAIVMIGAVDMDAFDVDLDIDTDVDGGAGSGGLPDTMLGVFKFLNVGEVPLMILLSVFVLMMWALGVLSHMLIGVWSVGVQLLALIPMTIVALLLTKVLTQPVRRIFARLDQDASAGSVAVLGQRCHVISVTADHRHGQAQIETGAAPIKINVKTPADGVILRRGDEAVVVTDRDDKGVYIIRGF